MNRLSANGNGILMWGLGLGLGQPSSRKKAPQ